MKTPHLSDGSRSWPLLNSFDLALIYLNSLGGNNVAQKYHLRSEEMTLLQIPIQLLLG